MKLKLKQVTSGEARRLLPPGSRLKFYDQSFTGEEYKLVSSEGVFHQVFPQACLSKLIPCFAIWNLDSKGNRVLVWAATCPFTEVDVSAWRRLQVPVIINLSCRLLRPEISMAEYETC